MADPESITVIEVGPFAPTGPQGPPGVPGQSGSTPTYPNKAALVAAVPTPYNGQSALLLDTYQLLVYRSTAPVGWFPPWNTAWGVLGYTVRGSAYPVQGVIDLMTFNYTAVPGRLYEVGTTINWLNQGVNTVAMITLYGAGPTPWVSPFAPIAHAIGGEWNTYTWSGLFANTASGTQTSKLAIQANPTTGILNTQAGTVLWMRDVGPTVGASGPVFRDSPPPSVPPAQGKKGKGHK